MDPLAAIRDTFFQECEEQLAELETGLLAMEGGDQDPETINAVFRAVETIGMPECALNLAHGVAYLSNAAKDRSAAHVAGVRRVAVRRPIRRVARVMISAIAGV